MSIFDNINEDINKFFKEISYYYYEHYITSYYDMVQILCRTLLLDYDTASKYYNEWERAGKPYKLY